MNEPFKLLIIAAFIDNAINSPAQQVNKLVLDPVSGT